MAQQGTGCEEKCLPAALSPSQQDFMRQSLPLPATGLAAGFAQLWLEATTVMTMRTWSLYLNTATPAERRLMVDEKAPALMNAAIEAWTAGTSAALRNPLDPFGGPMAAMDAWTRAVTRPARANRRRLIRNAYR